MSATSPFGSIWRKWDLHFHTPSSYDYQDGSVTNEQLIDGLVAAGIEVVAVTDHHVIDVARIRELQRIAGERLTVLPGIEFRSELGGSNSVHFIAVFPENCALDDVWTKLAGKLEITPSDVAKRGGDAGIYCDFADTAEIVHELGGLVSVHAGSKSNTIEGLKSANLINQKIKSDLVRESIDIYEIGDAKDIQIYREKVFPHLEFPVPLVACSDNHKISDYPKDGFFWLKGDRCFEALRQALYEPDCRVAVGESRPLEPFLKIEEIKVSAPEDAKLRSAGVEHPFCFRGQHKIFISPYLTCLIGGRGTGKSTLLNLIHEKLFPGKNEFFGTNRIASASGDGINDWISIDDDENRVEIEFLQQNEIEQFAVSPSRFTTAVFSRLKKLDVDGSLARLELEIEAKVEGLENQADRLREVFRLEDEISQMRRELQTNKGLVDSFENPEYKEIAAQLGASTREAQRLRGGSGRLSSFVKDVRSEVREHEARDGEEATVFDVAIRSAGGKIELALSEAETGEPIETGKQRIDALEAETRELKDKLGRFLESKGLSPENLADVKRASERIAELEERIPDSEERLAGLRMAIENFDPLSDLLARYDTQVHEVLDPINRILGDQSAEVKPIRLEYEFDHGAASRVILEELAEAVGNADERKVRVDHVSGALTDLAFDPVPTQEALVAAVVVPGKTGQALRDYFSDHRNYQLLVLQIQKHLLEVKQFRRINVFYDEKPIEASSFGQRCTAAIVVLLLLGNTPIIIDEPEAHLDSSLIAKYLVNLIKQKKQQRQIIFATHNANFVINGDAELIHVLDMGAENKTRITSTTIENLAHRERLLALEGGETAFVQRENRYGI